MFRIALTGDFYDPAGHLQFPDIGLDALRDVRGITVSALPEVRTDIGADQLAGVNGVIVLKPRVTRETLANAEQLLAVGRFGVGYDNIDVPACTAADVVFFIAKGAVDRPVAEATVGWMLALTHHVRVKDRLVREARWNDRSHFMGCELRGRTVGVIGFGGIGRALVRLLAGFDMKTPLVFDPYIDTATAEQWAVRKVSLAELMSEADFVSVHCPLTDETRNLLTARELALMKPTAYLLNTARGGIVEEDALYDTLAEGRIAGAAIDCFVGEPLTKPPRFAALDNVLLAPHAIAWTNELFRDNGRTVFRAMSDLCAGRQPQGVINPEVFARPSFQEKWRRVTAAFRG